MMIDNKWGEIKYDNGSQQITDNRWHQMTDDDRLLIDYDWIKITKEDSRLLKTDIGQHHEWW